MTMVSDGQAARSVLVESGLLDDLRPGTVVLEMSTIGPTAAMELAAEALRRDVHLLDAPVSGSVSLAEAGQLFVMVGGERAAYERATPVLDAMAKGHMLLGPSGAGAAMKLAVNAMISVTNESLAETLVLAERFGIERERAYDVLAGGALASPFVLYKRGAFLASRHGAGRVHDRPDAEGRRTRAGSRGSSRGAHAGRRRGRRGARRGARQRSGRCRHGVGDQPPHQ